MRSSVRSIMFALFVSLSLHAVHGQAPSPTPNDDSVTETENRDIRAFTEDLLARLSKTRDVRPLWNRYFVNDFGTFWDIYMSDSAKPDSKFPPLNRSERKRFVIAFQNFSYVTAPYSLLGQIDDFEKRLPSSLRRRYRMIEKVLDSDDSFETRRSILRFTQEVETFTDDLRRYSVRKKIESSESYEASVRKRQSLDDYNFRVMANSPISDSNGSAARWIRERSPDARTFTVGTPYGLAVLIIRANGKYKALFLLPWPMSYDPRVN